MVHHSREYSNAHSNAAKGRAKTAPRAKLRRETHSGENIISSSIIATARWTVEYCLLNFRSIEQNHAEIVKHFEAAPAVFITRSNRFDSVSRLKSHDSESALQSRLLAGQVSKRDGGNRTMNVPDRKNSCSITTGTGTRAGRKMRFGPRYSAYLSSLAPFALAMTFSQSAAAQEEDEQVLTPIEMFEAEVGQGYRVAPSVLMYAEVIGGVIHDTNIYNVAQNVRSDEVFQIKPRIVLGTDLSRHYFEVAGEADIRRYAEFGGENNETARVDAAGLLELGGQINVLSRAGIARGIEQRGTAGDQFTTDNPISYDRKYADVEISRGNRRLEIGLRGTVASIDYDDTLVGGVPVDITDRNYTTRDASLQLALNMGPRVKVYSRIEGNQLSYQTVPSKVRNSSGLSVMGGVFFEVTRLIKVDAGLGYFHQNFDSAAFASINEMDFHLEANWTPKPEWNFEARAERSIDGSPLANVPAIFRTTFSLEAQRSFNDRILLGNVTSYVTEEYRGIGRSDKRFGSDLTAQYRLTPNIGIIASAGYRHQGGGNVGRNYDGAAFSLAVRIVG